MRTSHRLSLLTSVCLTLTGLGLGLSLGGCAAGPLYPPRPPAVPGPPIADPSPAKVVFHTTISGMGLQKLLETAVPMTGQGTVPLLGGDRPYGWQRGPFQLRLDGRKLDVRGTVQATLTLPLLGTQSFPLNLRIVAEPVVSSDYRARLQGASVEVTSDDVRLRAAQGVAGALDRIRDQILGQLEGFAYDLKPLLTEAYQRIARPVPLPLGDAQGCALLRVSGLEAAPTVLADGVEKDWAVIVAPSVTLPCAVPMDAPPPPLPPLANVSALPTGPFAVTVPIAARYEELARAMTLAFTNGKLYFSKDMPELYLTDPEVFATSDKLVLKLRLAGPVNKGGIHVKLDGNIYFAGHPAVVDNELRVPDLEPTIETSSFLLRLKAAFDGDSIRSQAREALRLDLGSRFQAVKSKMSTDLGFAAGLGCVRADVARIEVTGVYPHASYLRVYVTMTAQAGVYLPCPR